MRSSPFLKLNALDAGKAIKAGSIIVHPAEGVYGLSCDPWNEQAVTSLCQMKKRPISMGLIMVASKVDQVLDLIDLNRLDINAWEQIKATWPGPNTWILPATDKVPVWVKGDHNGIGIRITSHVPLIHTIESFGKPIISTSANLHGQPTPTSIYDIKQLFPEVLGYQDGMIGSLGRPTAIRDAMSGKFLRK